MQKMTLQAVSAIAALLILTGCAQMNRSGVYAQQNQVQRTDNVEFGTVIAATDITIQGKSDYLGTGTGAVVGGVVGSQIGGGSGNKIATVVGGVVGGVAGGHVQQMAGNRSGQELTVQLDSGRAISVTQQTGQYFTAGERVRVVTGAVTRVIK